MHKSIIFILVLITLGCSSTQNKKEEMTKIEKVEALFNEFSNPEDPGLQYVVVDKDTVIYEYNSGLSDVEKKVSLCLGQTMAVFSMTKTLTAIAVLQLVEQKKIDIDDKVSKFFDHPYDDEITVRQLLSHTSGIPNPIPLKWAHLVENHHAYDEKKALDEVLKDNPKLKSPPAAKYKYSNIGYWLLGPVIEKASGKSYEDFVTENIFLPLGLGPDDIGFIINDVENHAKGYLKRWSFLNLIGGFLMEKDLFGDNENGWIHIRNVHQNGPAYGGAMGTAKAFARILQDLLSEDSKLLGPSGKQMLYEQQKLNSGEQIEMSLGWHIRKLDEQTYYFKEGGGAGFCCEMRIYPDSGIASVLMLNRTSFNFKKDLSKLDENFVLQ